MITGFRFGTLVEELTTHHARHVSTSVGCSERDQLSAFRDSDLSLPGLQRGLRCGMEVRRVWDGDCVCRPFASLDHDLEDIFQLRLREERASPTVRGIEKPIVVPEDAAHDDEVAPAAIALIWRLFAQPLDESCSQVICFRHVGILQVSSQIGAVIEGDVENGSLVWVVSQAGVGLHSAVPGHV